MSQLALQHFDEQTVAHLGLLLHEKHEHLGQLHLETSERSSTARNYDSSISSLRDYMRFHQEKIPTKSLLERWRDDMLAGRDPLPQAYSVSTVNAKLSAVRKLLRAVADDIVSVEMKLALRDWSKVAQAKATVIQDKIEEDYGIRLTLDELQKLIKSIDTSNIKGLRDRALIAVMAGAGLRVSEVSKLTLRDVFLSSNESGQRAIKVRRGKHGKQRVVVVESWNSWVIQAVEAYIGALGLSPMEEPDARVFRGVKAFRDGSYRSKGQSLSRRGVQRAVEAYMATYRGQQIQIAAHDLRRTFAKLCKTYGMSWEALREQMGHSSVIITEEYVGRDVDWSERVPNWSIQL